MILWSAALASPTLAELQKASRDAVAQHGEPDHRARCLASHSLWIREPTELDVPLAKTLATYDGACLLLDGVHTATPEALALLVRGKATGITLDGLTTLTVAQATPFADFNGELTLDGLTHLDADVALALGHGVWSGPKRLFLDGLTSLDGPTADALSKYNTVMLHLDGLQELTPEAARGLASWDGPIGRILSLNGLKQLSPGAAEGLAQLRVDSIDSLSLEGLETLSPKAAAALVGDKEHGWSTMRLPVHRFDTATLDVLTTWDTRELEELICTGSTPSAEKLVVLGRWSGDGELVLSAETLDLETAMALGSFGGRTLELRELGTASDDVVTALTGFQGSRLTLGLPTLTDAQVASLVGWQGYTVILPNLEAAPKQVEQLEARQGSVHCPACEQKPY